MPKRNSFHHIQAIFATHPRPVSPEIQANDSTKEEEGPAMSQRQAQRGKSCCMDPLLGGFIFTLVQMWKLRLGKLSDPPMELGLDSGP